jgi:hypothetical protein
MTAVHNSPSRLLKEYTDSVALFLTIFSLVVSSIPSRADTVAIPASRGKAVLAMCENSLLRGVFNAMLFAPPSRWSIRA